MKKNILLLIVLILIFALTACNGNTSEADSTAISSDSPAGDGSTPQFEMPIETKLLLGTVKLDETDYAVDAEQASQLLPLWKAMRSLGESETAAQAEIDAVTSQIEETMTADQMKAIDGMNLTMQDFASVAETLGIETGFGDGSFGQADPEMRATMEAARQSGDFPVPSDGGGGPEGGFGPGGGQGFGPGGGQDFGGQGFDPEARQTAIAENGGNRGAGFGVNMALLDAIIEFLTAKTE